MHHSPQGLVDVVPLNSDRVTVQVLVQPFLENLQLGLRVSLKIYRRAWSCRFHRTPVTYVTRGDHVLDINF